MIERKITTVISRMELIVNLVFDYLRDNMKVSVSDTVQRDS